MQDSKCEHILTLQFLVKQCELPLSTKLLEVLQKILFLQAYTCTQIHLIENRFFFKSFSQTNDYLLGLWQIVVICKQNINFLMKIWGKIAFYSIFQHFQNQQQQYQQ
eukprot:EC096116.1.p5 GENE.EC096116.1~~EC096116.1.p5  ORF type:complete len:107 (-),score=8.33 EC096116.1:101-421(-)